MFPIELFGVKTYPAKSTRNLGVIFYKNFKFRSHISVICSACFYHIWDLRHTHRYLDLNGAKLLANALMSSPLDYCNSFLFGFADTDLAKLQCVQNWLARVVTKSLPFGRSVPLLRSLYWLPVKFRVDFKICLLIYRTLSEKQPVYLHSFLASPLPPRSLRSNKGITFLYLESRPMLGKGHLALVPLLFGTACHYQSVHPLQFSPPVNVSKRLFDMPFPHRHQYAQWPVDVVELLHRFCCWALIWMSRHWAWLRRGYWRYRNLVGWLIDWLILWPFAERAQLWQQVHWARSPFYIHHWLESQTSIFSWHSVNHIIFHTKILLNQSHLLMDAFAHFVGIMSRMF